MHDVDELTLECISSIRANFYRSIAIRLKKPLKQIAEALDIELAILFAGDDVHVFDMVRFRRAYKKADELKLVYLSFVVFVWTVGATSPRRA